MLFAAGALSNSCLSENTIGLYTTNSYIYHFGGEYEGRLADLGV